MDDFNTTNQPTTNAFPTPEQPIGGPNGVVTSDNDSWDHKKVYKAAVAVVIVVVVAVLATVVGIHKNNGTPQPPATNFVQSDDYPYRYVASVALQHNSLSPSALSVQPQTNVTIENNDSTSHYLNVSQDDNTTGGILSLLSNNKTYNYNEGGFADNIVIPANSGYQYVFSTPGTYYYHDVNNAAINGEIIVQQ